MGELLWELQKGPMNKSIFCKEKEGESIFHEKRPQMHLMQMERGHPASFQCIVIPSHIISGWHHTLFGATNISSACLWHFLPSDSCGRWAAWFSRLSQAWMCLTRLTWGWTNYPIRPTQGIKLKVAHLFTFTQTSDTFCAQLAVGGIKHGFPSCRKPECA